MSLLSAGDPVPRYARLAQLLRQRIDKGFWKPGERLPRLEALMAEFDVARVTARQAVDPPLAWDGATIQLVSSSYRHDGRTIHRRCRGPGRSRSSLSVPASTSPA